jgi:UDP-N-acetylglucosamine:LPS N-acetylglucosamine transferase
MHQKHNAQPLIDLGGAVMAIDRIDAAENVREVGPILQELMKDSERRSTMRAKLRHHEFTDAARTIAEMLV